jgi:hypothetical protein
MKPILIAFLSSWLLLVFASLATSTDAYQPSALAGIVPFYVLSLALFSFLFATWRGELLGLAMVSAFYQATIAGLAYLKYPLLYGSIFDTMFHFSLAQSILNTGHVPGGNPYFGFTTFHSFAAILSLLSGLPLITAFKIETFILPALVQIASFWIVGDVLRKRSTTKLAILGAVIAFTFNYTSGPQVMAAFLVVLSFALMIQFARDDPTALKQGFMVSLILLIFAIVITHHQTAFFTIFAFIGVGLLLPLIKTMLRTSAVVVQRVELVGLLSLGFAYIWWTDYAHFTDFISNVFSIITGEPLQFQTTVGRGIFFYGPITWAFRTVINYAQRGQLIVWMTIGVLVAGVTLVTKARWDKVDSDTHAIIFSCLMLFLGVYVFFLFVPFFVIGSDRFFRFMAFVSPPFIAIGIESTYAFSMKVGRLLNSKIPDFLSHTTLHAVITFLLLVFIFVELTGPLLLPGVYAASSQYQIDQITFIGSHSTIGTHIISHVVVSNQIQAYAPDIPTGLIAPREDSVSVLYTLYSEGQLLPYSQHSLLLVQRIGPAGTYFEAVTSYQNTTWVPNALEQLISLRSTSVIYNSGESFVTSEP